MKVYVMNVRCTLENWDSPERGITIREEDGSFFPGEKALHPAPRDAIDRARKHGPGFFEEIDF